MKVRGRIIDAARTLAAEKAVEDISLAELSRAAGVSWPTVRRHVGGREGLPRFLREIGVRAVDAAAAEPGAIQPIDTRSRILEAAFRIFAERGYSGATLDDVAADAGMTKGAVYWHFASKDDLCMALIEDRFQREGLRFPAEVRSAFQERSGEEGVVAFMAHEVEQARKAERWRLLGFEFMSRSRNPALRDRYADLVRQIYDEVVPVSKWLIDSGIVSKDVDPVALAVVWRCLILGMGQWMTQDPDGVAFEAMAPKLAHIIWHGMAPDRADEGGAGGIGTDSEPAEPDNG